MWRSRHRILHLQTAQSGALSPGPPPPIGSQTKVLAVVSWNVAGAVSWCDSHTAGMFQSDADTDLGEGDEGVLSQKASSLPPHVPGGSLTF